MITRGSEQPHFAAVPHFASDFVIYIGEVPIGGHHVTSRAAIYAQEREIPW